jgi:hypothetical protein
MLKHSKRSANFSLGSLQEELVNEEINQKAINAKLLTNISSIDLNFVNSISVDVLICTVLDLCCRSYRFVIVCITCKCLCKCSKVIVLYAETLLIV